MLGRNSVQTRINSESGISFTEFSYQVLQGYDWLHLLDNYKCRLQIGGSDQMGNIMSGHELISRTSCEDVFGKLRQTSAQNQLTFNFFPSQKV